MSKEALALSALLLANCGAPALVPPASPNVQINPAPTVSQEVIEGTQRVLNPTEEPMGDDVRAACKTHCPEGLTKAVLPLTYSNLCGGGVEICLPPEFKTLENFTASCLKSNLVVDYDTSFAEYHKAICRPPIDPYCKGLGSYITKGPDPRNPNLTLDGCNNYRSYEILENECAIDGYSVILKTCEENDGTRVNFWDCNTPENDDGCTGAWIN